MVEYAGEGENEESSQSRKVIEREGVPSSIRNHYEERNRIIWEEGRENQTTGSHAGPGKAGKVQGKKVLNSSIEAYGEYRGGKGGHSPKEDYHLYSAWMRDKEFGGHYPEQSLRKILAQCKLPLEKKGTETFESTQERDK